MEDIIGTQDITTKDYMKDVYLFADVFNQHLFKGEQVVDPEALMEADINESIVLGGAEIKLPKETYRDVKKYWNIMTEGGKTYCMLGIENQSYVNYAMPARCALYDALGLSSQLSQIASKHKHDVKEKRVKAPSKPEFTSGFWKSDKLLPIYTVVIYFGADQWDGPMTLREMYDEKSLDMLGVNDGILDYRMNLVTPYDLTEEELSKFKPDLKNLFGFIKYSEDKDKLEEFLNKNQDPVSNNTIRLINKITNSNLKADEEKGKTIMCKATRDMIEEGREEGRAEGREEGKKEGIKEGREEGGVEMLISSYLDFDATKEQILSALVRKLSMTMEKAEELFSNYILTNNISM